MVLAMCKKDCGPGGRKSTCLHIEEIKLAIKLLKLAIKLL